MVNQSADGRHNFRGVRLIRERPGDKIVQHVNDDQRFHWFTSEEPRSFTDQRSYAAGAPFMVCVPHWRRAASWLADRLCESWKLPVGRQAESSAHGSE